MSNSQNTGGVGLPVLVTVVFVILKLTGVIAAWSWWWVLSPLWIAFGLWVIIMPIVIIIALASRRVARRRALAFRNQFFGRDE